MTKVSLKGIDLQYLEVKLYEINTCSVAFYFEHSYLQMAKNLKN